MRPKISVKIAECSFWFEKRVGHTINSNGNEQRPNTCQGMSIIKSGLQVKGVHIFDDRDIVESYNWVVVEKTRIVNCSRNV